jgi:hypothetical protein
LYWLDDFCDQTTSGLQLCHCPETEMIAFTLNASSVIASSAAKVLSNATGQRFDRLPLRLSA